jgi:outer membrane protein assembly factor BamD
MSFRKLAPIFALPLVMAGAAWAQNPSQQGRTPPGAEVRTGGITGEEAAVYATANDHYEAGQLSLALTAYRGFLKAYPASALAAKAQYRVAEILDAQGNSNKAFDAYQTLVSRYPDTPEFEQAVAQQVIIANGFLQGRRVDFLGIPILPGAERAQQMYEAILKNAPYSKHAPIAQFNLGLSLERQKMVPAARQAFQTVLDKYPNSDVADDALYQIGYIYMRTGLSGQSQDLSSLVLAKETFEDFLLQFPNSEKAAQARDNLATIGARESGDIMAIAKYYDWAKNYKAAVIYYNDVIRKQPKTADAEEAKSRVEALRAQLGDDALRVGSDRAESGEQLALRRRLQAQVETSALADYSGPPKRDIVPDELPVVRQPRLRTNVRGDVRPLPAPVEPILPTE